MPGLYEAPAKSVRIGRGSKLRRVPTKHILRQKSQSLENLQQTFLHKIRMELLAIPSTHEDPAVKPPRKGKVKPPNNKKVLRDGLKVKASEELTRLHRISFGEGLRTSDPNLRMSAVEGLWIKEYLTDELTRFSKFFDGIADGTVSLAQMDARLKMYVNASAATYDSGRVAGSNPNSLFYWVTNPVKEHCSICVYLASHSPYTVETLPTVPRSGSCKGFSNCGCHLAIEVVSPEVVREINRNSKSKQYLLKRIQQMREQR